MDIIHVIESLWRAGECLFRAGTPELTDWVHEQKDLLYQGQEALLVQRLRERLDGIAPTGPCAQSTMDESTGSFWPVLQRSRCQGESCGGPLQPVPWPRNTLLCPLHDSALAGDPTVPCTRALLMLPHDVAPHQSLLPLLEEGGPGGFQLRYT